MSCCEYRARLSCLSLTSPDVTICVSIATGYLFTTVQISNWHAVHILQKTGTAPIVSYFAPQRMAPTNGTLWGTATNNSARIRTSEFNSNTTTANLALAYFTPLVLQISTNFTNSIINLPSNAFNSSLTIQDVCFGSTANDVYVLTL